MLTTSPAGQESGTVQCICYQRLHEPQAIDSIAPYLDAANVRPEKLQRHLLQKGLQGTKTAVLDAIAYMKSIGIWLEVTTLLTPGENDSDEEIRCIAAFIAGVDKDIPWHILRFYPEYNFVDHPVTTIEALRKAREIGVETRLRHVYFGNARQGSDTYCPKCRVLLLKRSHLKSIRIALPRDVVLHAGRKFPVSGDESSRCKNCLLPHGLFVVTSDYLKRLRSTSTLPD